MAKPSLRKKFFLRHKQKKNKNFTPKIEYITDESTKKFLYQHERKINFHPKKKSLFSIFDDSYEKERDKNSTEFKDWDSFNFKDFSQVKIKFDFSLFESNILKNKSKVI